MPGGNDDLIAGRGLTTRPVAIAGVFTRSMTAGAAARSLVPRILPLGREGTRPSSSILPAISNGPFHTGGSGKRMLVEDDRRRPTAPTYFRCGSKGWSFVSPSSTRRHRRAAASGGKKII